MWRNKFFVVTAHSAVVPRLDRGIHSNQKQSHGFTLVEILIALFIFTIVSIILVGALRRVIDAEQRTSARAEQLSQLQMSMLLMQRDVEQIIDRPIINKQGKPEASFLGDKQHFVFTHAGFANFGHSPHSNMQRSAYLMSDNTLLRRTYPVLDQVPGTTGHDRLLLPSVTEAYFQYLDTNGRLTDHWPPSSHGGEILPKAIKITLTLENWGTLSQLLIIPVDGNKNAA